MAKLKFIPKTDLEYVEFYSNELKKNNSFFEQQKRLINSQIRSSKSLFLKTFGKGEMFKKNARDYLKGRGILSYESGLTSHNAY